MDTSRVWMPRLRSGLLWTAAVLGGLIAGRWGVTGPFWFGFAGSAVFLVLIWRQLLYVAHADEEILAGASATEER